MNPSSLYGIRHFASGVFLLSSMAGTSFAEFTAPAWWNEPATKIWSGVEPSLAFESNSLVNIAQLKHVSTQGKRYLDTALASIGGASLAVDALFVFDRSDPHAIANVGQVKSLVKPIYDQLFAIGYPVRERLTSAGFSAAALAAYPAGAPVYPWDPAVTDGNGKAVTIGQLKMAFSFDLNNANWLYDDSDSDGIPNWWETFRFGSLLKTGSGDEDGDGISNADEYLLGTDPTIALWNQTTGAGVVGYSYTNARFTALANEEVKGVAYGYDAAGNIERIGPAQ